MNIMNESICTNGSTRGDWLVAYLFNEMAVDERAGFDRHLASCAICRAELEALRDVRLELKQWAPPEPAFRVTVAPAIPGGGRRGRWASLQQIPVWAQVAAATLFIGVAAGMANLEVSYDANGVSVRTGWRHPDSVGPVPAVAVTTEPASPWRAELAELEQRLRSDLAAHPVAVQSQVVPPLSEDATIRRVRALLQESEQRQRRELGLRFAEMAREVEMQRQADLVKIDRSLGLISSRTGMEVMRTQQQVNSLAQRVSQRR